MIFELIRCSIDVLAGEPTLTLARFHETIHSVRVMNNICEFLFCR